MTVCEFVNITAAFLFVVFVHRKRIKRSAISRSENTINRYCVRSDDALQLSSELRTSWRAVVRKTPSRNRARATRTLRMRTLFVYTYYTMYHIGPLRSLAHYHNNNIPTSPPPPPPPPPTTRTGDRARSTHVSLRASLAAVRRSERQRPFTV